MPAEENHTRLGECGCIRVREFTKKIQKYILNKFCSFTIMTYEYNIYNLDNMCITKQTIEIKSESYEGSGMTPGKNHQNQ